MWINTKLTIYTQCTAWPCPLQYPHFFLLISLIKGQQKCSYRQNNYCCSCSEDGLSMSFWKIMNWLQSKGKGHCPSKSCSRPQSAKFRHQNKEKDIRKKQFLSLAELIKLHMVKSMNCVDWFLTTIPKCLLVFWRYLSMSRSDQIDQVSTREDIRGSAWNHPWILLSTFKWNVKAKHKIVKFNSGFKHKQKRSHIWLSKL